MVNQVVLLAGGKGTRMRELTETIPKPMVKVGELPVLEHLINIFEFFNDFSYLVASGYKGEIIDNHFKNFDNVKTIFTGDETNTGGRVFKLKDNLDDIFIVTYGDGLANVNINELIKFHNSHNKIGTITVTNPISRFGLVDFDNNNIVKKFIEKPKLDGFVNIGFMVLNKQVFNYLNEDLPFENEPLVNLAKNKELGAFKHHGFFRPMDTYREYLELNDLWGKNKAPWKPGLNN